MSSLFGKTNSSDKSLPVAVGGAASTVSAIFGSVAGSGSGPVPSPTSANSTGSVGSVNAGSDEITPDAPDSASSGGDRKTARSVQIPTTRINAMLSPRLEPLQGVFSLEAKLLDAKV